MYVYAAEMPVDYYNGMTNLIDYISLCLHNFKNKESHLLYSECSYLSYFELQKFLINSFMAVHCSVAGWDGDIRGNNIFISAIPWLDNTTKKILAFKQDNNGCSFIASEFPMPLETKEEKQQFQISKLHDLTSHTLMFYFNESFNLTMSLIEKANEINSSQINVIHLNDLKKIAENLSNKEELQKKDKMSDFEKIG